ncbi:MAG: hypothetical protein AAF441_16575, partial [Pseudomonadota bacterium]
AIFFNIAIIISIHLENAIENNGIYDKFTGDGVLIHFLEDECRAFPVDREIASKLEVSHSGQLNWQSYETTGGHHAVVDAMACAFEMIQAIEVHALKLRRISRTLDLDFGPVAGFAKGTAQWSVSQSGEPIVVGQSVVDACRFADDAVRGEVRTSPHIQNLLYEVGISSNETIVEHKSKDTRDSDREAVYRYTEPPAGVCRAAGDIERIVTTIQRDLY